MATYIKGLTDTLPGVTMFQPDSNSIQRTLSTLQARYDQGFASLKNVYNQVLNAPLSDANNQEVQKNFLKEAQSRLKNLASVDLSLPENQAAAEEVFAPFWEDNLILADTGYTKWYQGEMKKAMDTRDSKDDKVRSQYSDVVMRYLQNGLEQLQGAGRDASKYAQLEKRRFTPFQDVQAYLDGRAKEQGLEISWQTANGPELKTITGGKESLPSFESFAHNALGDQFTDQFRIMGVVDKEEKVKQLMKWNPTLTYQTAMNMISSSIIKEKKDGMTAQQGKWEADLKRITDEIKPYQTLPGLTTEQKNAYTRLLLTQAQLKKQVEQGSSALAQFASLEQTPERFSDKLDGYFSDVIKERTIKRWANTRAAKQEVKTSQNTLWEAQYKVAKDERDYQWERWKFEHPQKKGKKSSGSGSSSSSGDDDDDVDISDPEQTGHYESVDTTHMSEIGEPEKIFNHEQSERWSYAHQELFSDDVGGRILRKKNIPTERAVEYLGAMRKLSTDPEGENLTDNDKALLYNLSQELQGKSAPGDLMTLDEAGKVRKAKGGFGEKNFFQVRKELLGAMKDNLDKTFRDDSPGYEDDDFKMMVGYMTATEALQEYDTLETNKSELIEKHILGNKEYEPFVVEHGGNKKLISSDDLAKQFQRTVVKDDKVQLIEYSAKDMASMYMNGQIGFMHKSHMRIEINGRECWVEQYGDVNRKDEALKMKKEVTAPGVWGKFKEAMNTWADVKDPYGVLVDSVEALDDRYGSSKKFKQKMDGAYKKIVPDLPQYQSKTGAMGFVVRYDLNKKTQGEAAVGILNEAAQAGNLDGVYLNGSQLALGDGTRNAILSAMALGEKDLEDVVSAVRLRTRGVNGRPSLEISFKPSTKAKEENLTPIERLAGQKVEIDLNPNPTGDTLRRIRYNPGNYVYGSLLRGKMVKSDAILEAAHISYKIMPDDPNNPSGAIVEINAKDFVNGKWVDAKQSRATYSWSQYTPDQLVGKVNEIVRMQYLKNLQARKSYYQWNPQGAPGSDKLVTPKEVEEQVRAMAEQAGIGVST